MYSSCEKPHLFLERERDYHEHLRRINRILTDHKVKENYWKQQPTFPRSNKPQNHRLNERRISEENQRLAHKIITISRRKSSSHTAVHLPSRPLRRTQKKKIELENSQLAQRLIAKQSQFSRVKMLKGIEQYERLKRSMMKNRRPHLSYSTEIAVDVASLSLS